MSENNANMNNANNQQQDLNDILRVRREKLAELQANGKDPFVITKYNVTAQSTEIKGDYASFEGKTVSIAGRMMSKRVMGKASFCNVQDRDGSIQSYVARDSIGEDEYKEFKRMDIGDIVGIEGEVFTTKTGEISIHATKVTLLSKSLQVLPEKFHGLKDTDLRYRQRYVDLIVNPEVKRNFIIRSQFIKFMRRYLDDRKYIEVETPVLNTIAGGASARPFITHHNTLDLEMYMRIATELPLKRLIVGGMDKVYEVGRIFRNEGMDAFHNPEFTTIEMYQAYSDYFDMMDLIEDLYKTVTLNTCGTLEIPFGEHVINMGEWTRLTMAESVKKYAGVDFNDWATDEEARAVAKEKGVELEHGNESTKGHVLIDFFETFVEHNLIQPTIIYDYPVENSPLAKRKPSNPAFVERFEYFMCGKEFGNAFSELNDPIDQKQRMLKQIEAKRAKGNNEAQLDEDFINALEYGLPPTGGLGMGVDRFVMLLTNSATIRDVILFPTMKPKK